MLFLTYYNTFIYRNQAFIFLDLFLAASSSDLSDSDADHVYKKTKTKKSAGNFQQSCKTWYKMGLKQLSKT